MKLLVLCLALVACDHWNRSCEDLSDWSVSFTRGSVVATRAPDGSVFVVGRSFGGTAAGQPIDGSFYAHLGDDGAVLAVAHLPITDELVRAVRADASGVVVISGSYGTQNVTKLGLDLQPLWSVAFVDDGYSQLLALGPNGEIAMVATTPQTPQGMMRETHVFYLNDDGTTRWSAPANEGMTLHFTSTADLVVFSPSDQGLHRQVLAAADGTSIDDAFLEPADVILVVPDGGYEYVRRVSVQTITIRRVDGAGTELWSTQRDGAPYAAFVGASNGDVLVGVAAEELHVPGGDLAIIDGANGSERARVPLCEAIELFAADASHAFGVWQAGGGEVHYGVSRYSLAP